MLTNRSRHKVKERRTLWVHVAEHFKLLLEIYIYACVLLLMARSEPNPTVHSNWILL
jgi:hypothetical protein